VAKFKYLGMTLTNQIEIHDEIKSRLNSGNAWYHSVSYKKLKIKICTTVILPVVLYGCETWSLTLREEHRLRVFENRVLRKMDHQHSLDSSPNIVRMIKSRRMRWAGHVACMGRGKTFTGFWLGGPKGRDH
jgi:hypothetical protein